MTKENLNNDDDNEEESDFSTDLAVVAFASTSNAFIHKEPLINPESREILRDKNGNILYKMNYDAEKHRNFHKNLLLNYDVFCVELEAETAQPLKNESIKVDADFEDEGLTVDEVIEATKKQINEMTQDQEKQG